MGLFRDKKDIKTIMDLEDTITYLRKLLQAKETTMSQLEITAELRLKEIERLNNKLEKYEQREKNEDAIELKIDGNSIVASPKAKITQLKIDDVNRNAVSSDLLEKPKKKRVAKKAQ